MPGARHSIPNAGTPSFKHLHRTAPHCTAPHREQGDGDAAAAAAAVLQAVVLVLAAAVDAVVDAAVCAVSSVAEEEEDTATAAAAAAAVLATVSMQLSGLPDLFLLQEPNCSSKRSDLDQTICPPRVHLTKLHLTPT